MAIYFAFIAVLLALSGLKSRKVGIFLAVLISFLFIGLRYETGFDWPVYKDSFDKLSHNYSLESIAFQSLVTSQEVTFIALSGAMSQILPSFECAQALFTLFFLVSFFKLTNEIPGSRPILALAIYFSFFLLPIGFSTIRQTLAISFFNWGLAVYFRGNRRKSYLFFLLATAAQLSALLYVLGLVVSDMRIARRLFNPVFYSLFSVVFILAFPLLLELVAAAIPFIASKLSFYREIAISSYFGITTTGLLILIFIIGLIAVRDLQQRKSFSSRLPPAFLRLIAIISAFAVGGFFFTVMRERLSYEVILLFSIFLTTRITNVRVTGAIAIIVVGLFFQTRTYFQYPFYLAFIPYQNGPVLWMTGSESTGQERSQLYLDIFEEQFR